MSIEAVNQFLTKVSQDEKLQTELTQAMGPNKERIGAVNLASQYGYKFTLQEYEQQINELQKVQTEGELSEQELESVTGGFWTALLSGAAGGLSVGML